MTLGEKKKKERPRISCSHSSFADKFPSFLREGRDFVLLENGIPVASRDEREITRIYELFKNDKDVRNLENFLVSVYSDIEKLQKFRGNEKHSLYITYVSHMKLSKEQPPYPAPLKNDWALWHQIISISGSFLWHDVGKMQVPVDWQKQNLELDLNDYDGVEDALRHIKMIEIMGT